MRYSWPAGVDTSTRGAGQRRQAAIRSRADVQDPVSAGAVFLSDEAAEFQIKDRLSFQRFLELALHGRVPDDTKVWFFREQLVNSGAIDKLFLCLRAYRSRLSRYGRPDTGCDDRSGGQAGQYRRRTKLSSSAACLQAIHQRRLPRRPMPERIARTNAKWSAIRSAFEHVFAGQKHRMGLFIRTISMARARMKFGMANLAYDFQSSPSRRVMRTGATARHRLHRGL